MYFRLINLNLLNVILVFMAATKSTTKTPAKVHYICDMCETEFNGTECPECGNRKGNRKLASDGIEQQLHNSNVVFETADQLEGYGPAT